MEKRISINWLAPVVGAFLFVILMLATHATAQAAPPHGFGQGQGRTDTVNENDFHTASWERFSFNYHFVSGPDHRFELGRPTQFNGFVPVDIFTANFRSDAHVSLRPPAYGIFSAHIQTAPVNHLFPQPVNPHFWPMNLWDDPNVDPRFDTLRQGVNAPQTSSSHTTTQTVDTGGFLPPTSIGE